jgi:DNA-binding FadR family transcriptional regulator
VGDRLPSERELAGIMRISRPTLREAVKTLVEAGVLEVRRGQSGGIFVASSWSRATCSEPPGDPRERGSRACSEARRLLEPRVAQLAAVHASEEDFAAMAALIDRKRTLAAADDFLENEDLFLQLDLKFHLAMARATRNSTVVQLMRSLFRRLEIARDMAVHAPLVPDWVISIHERTLAAIRSADFPLIDSVMDEHLAQLEQIWERETGRGLVRPLPDFLQPGGRPLARAAGRLRPQAAGSNSASRFRFRPRAGHERGDHHGREADPQQVQQPAAREPEREQRVHRRPGSAAPRSARAGRTRA